MKPILIVLCCLTVLVPAQEEGAKKPQTTVSRSSAATVAAADVVLELVPAGIGPEVHELVSILDSLYGRRLHIIMQDGSFRSARNISVYGKSLVLQDTRDMVADMKKTLALLRQENRLGTEDELVVVEYKTRFISVHDARKALEPLSRSVRSATRSVSSLRNTQRTGNVSHLNERSVLVLRDTRDQVDRMLALLKRLDQPKSQLLISCTLVQGSNGPEQPRATQLIPEELRSLSPHKTFHIIATGVLRTTAGSGPQIELSMRRGPGASTSISLESTASGKNSGTLALANVNVNIQSTEDDKKPGVTQQSFSTSTSITRDEYVVLGAFGTNPVFVILKLTEVK